MNHREDKMTEQERDETRWNIIEVETKYNVPQTARHLATAMQYKLIPDFLADFMSKVTAGRTKEERAAIYRASFNNRWQYEFVDKAVTGYWMNGSEAFNHWYTEDENGVQICHYVFFERVS